MHRYKVVVSFVGDNYVGWQSQNNGLGIQSVIEKVISNICNEPIKIVSSGRTDAKVNSKGLTFHFDTLKKMENQRWKSAINGYLPEDIYVNSVEEVSKLFHARYSVLYKVYEYKINMGEYDVFNKNHILNYGHLLNVDDMIEASKSFIGFHDFTSFCVNPISLYPNQKREIYNIDFKIENNVLCITFKGKGFLRYMVRMIVATLIEVGKGTLNSDDVLKLLEAKNKEVVKKNVSGNGLTLKKVEYFRIIYLDDNILIRSVHEEDKRLLNGEVDLLNLYGICNRNCEEFIGFLRYVDGKLINLNNLEIINNDIVYEAINNIENILF